MKRNLESFGRALLVLAAATAAGCQSPLSDAWRQDSVERLEQEVQRLRAAAAAEPQRPAAPLELPAGAGPDDYVALALSRNPTIAAAAARLQRLAARVPQATSLDDPMLQVAPIGKMAQTAAGEVGLMTGVSQRLPFPGKLDARGQVALREFAAAASELEQARLEVAGDARRAYWSYYLAFHSAEVTRQSLGLLQQIQQTAQASYRAGRVPQQDVLRVTTEIGQTEAELADVLQRVTTAAAMLNQLMDRPVNAALPAPPDTSIATVEASLDAVLSNAAARNPQIEQVRQQLAAARARLRLARLQRYPDLTVSLNYNFVDDDGLAAMANGDDQWWLGFAINLPIWVEKYRAMEVEALRGVVEQGANLRATQNRMAFRIADALARVDAQHQTVDLLRQRILPDARQTLDVSLSAYRAGQIEFLTVVDNWRQLLRLQLLEISAVSQLNQAAADLEEASGGAAAEAGVDAEADAAPESMEPQPAPRPLSTIDPSAAPAAASPGSGP